MGLIFTDKALEKVKEYIAEAAKEQDAPTKLYFRIAVKNGGCSGFEYVMSIDKVMSRTDLMQSQSGLEIVVDKKSILYIDGCTIDYVESMMGSGFKVSNPNAKGSCGCGQSFDV
ncbi:MAG: iron-sulfur cluster assembly accessory protein [Candidatus Aenigmarchaeota archaeon]|nr:iron-sulfur cluster assembly accessory protein [Candidatus Aenigmarchaeota archaeon]